jgi:hypothetical protein
MKPTPKPALPSAPKRVGTYTPGEYRATTEIGKEREMLAAELNWPNDMTLEDLRAEAKARAAFWARADGEAAE